MVDPCLFLGFFGLDGSFLFLLDLLLNQFLLGRRWLVLTFFNLEIVQYLILVKHLCFDVVVSPLKPSVLIEAFSVQKHESENGLVVSFVDTLAHISQVESEHLIAADLVFLFA